LDWVELRKDPSPSADSERWYVARTPPDYRDRNLLLGARKDHLKTEHRVLLVDDWIDTGGQATGARTIVEQAGASWCGVAVIVDGLRDSRLRRDLDVRALLHLREL
jgi:adenine phosphoribosyltransferase